MNKLIVEFNKFVDYGNQPTYTITYENPVFLMNETGEEDKMCDIDSKLLNNIMNELIQNFNESELEQYMDENDIKNSDRIISIKASNYNINNNSFYINVDIKDKPSKEDIDKIKDYIEGQCSNGWGEGFEQSDIYGYSVSTWGFKQKRTIKYLEIKDSYK